jgi:glycosyltransferase involved in cell wall biosynthesis
MIKVLVITHDLSLSGAPKSLLYTFEYISKNHKNQFEIDVVTLSPKGELLDRFKKNCRYFHVLPNNNQKTDFVLLNKISRKILGKKQSKSPRETFIDVLSNEKYQIIYANTIVSLNLALQIKSKSINSKLVLHVHELSTVIDEYSPNFLELNSLVDVFIVPSDLNRRCLISKYLIHHSKIHLIREASKLEMKDSTSASDDPSFYNVMMCGGAYWRKGDDIFIQVANIVKKENPLIKFYWVGYQSEERKRVNELDIKNMQLSENVFFVGLTEKPNDWLSMMDLFFLSSREDPFPLAAIEAGMFGLPICCFENATGITEIIEDKEMIAPYSDIYCMANIILNCFNQRIIKKEQGMKDRSLYLNFLPDQIGRQTVELLLTF